MSDLAALGTIRLYGDGTTVVAGGLRDQLVVAADHAGSIVIDARDVLSVGQAVLQVLIAARRDAHERAHDLQYAGASAAFRDRITACTLADAIGLLPEKDVTP